METSVKLPTEKKNVRHAEKRRTATCRFADRVAHESINVYRMVVPEKDRPAQTCVAAVVAHSRDDGGKLFVVGLGVGTKFLSEKMLRSEASSSTQYGRRVRDCHAEVLARRAFRRQLTLEMIEDIKRVSSSEDADKNRLLERQPNENGTTIFRLRPGVTIHFYSSSVPCGNAALKKFAKMSKEKFREELGDDQWPSQPHVPISDSSIHLGQFALLIKKDNETNLLIGSSDDNEFSTNGSMCSSLLSDAWNPPGTTTVSMHHKGSIHTCSDKLARWNYLGLQGSLLASLLSNPLYLSSLSVGRKFTECICRRAVCCRTQVMARKNKRAIMQLTGTQEHEPGRFESMATRNYRYNHPAIMGNAVYLDEDGVVETSSDVRGQDVRFHSSRAWCWWPSIGREENSTSFAECLDGATGYLWKDPADESAADEFAAEVSRVSTISLVEIFLEANKLMRSLGDGTHSKEESSRLSQSPFGSLEDLKEVKRTLAKDHEAVKEALLTNHPIFQKWRRRL